MTQDDLAYEAWSALDRFTSHPDIEDQKRQIIDRTLKRIEQVTMMRDMDEILKLRAGQVGHY